MTVTLYSNTSDWIVVNKNISTVATINNVLCKEPTDILEPVLFIQTNANITSFNYCYIPDFGRYYEAKPITRNGNNIQIQCKVDPLMSHKSKIIGLPAIVERQENLYNLYINDLQYQSLNYPRVQTKKFSGSFNSTQTYILICAGGDINA